MCGICGVYNYGVKEKPVERSLIQAMMDKMQDRGPDDAGTYFAGSLALGFRRLAIIDILGGHQPLSDESEKFWLVLNGEIYNYPALRQDLITKGHYFKTKTDAEVVLHLYQDYGLDFLQKLEGMFAFALWDDHSKLLILARDRLGIKPLYYFKDDKRFCFASSLNSLFCHPDIPKSLDPFALYDFLSLRYVPAPQTLFLGVRKLLPGHFLLVKPEGIQERVYWDIPLDSLQIPDKEAKEAVTVKLKEVISSHLISDVPVGAFLSGGLDSSIVVGGMVKAGAKPKTFSAVFKHGQGYNELEYAKMVADYWGLENFQVLIGPEDLKQNLAAIVEILGEPIADPAAVAGYILSELASAQVKVVLTGEGADETFAGYRRYYWAQKRQGLLKWLPRAGKNALRFAETINMNGRHLRTLSLLVEPDPFIAYMENIALFNKKERQGLSGSVLKNVIGEYAFAQRHKEAFVWASNNNLLERMLYTDAKFWLPDDLLLKMDKVSMAHSLEARIPFLDHKLVELAWRLAGRMKYRGSISKYILRQAAEEFLPAVIRKRAKHAFDLPLKRWLGQDLFDFSQELILEMEFIKKGWLNRKYILQMLRDQKNGRYDYSLQIFALMTLSLWENIYLKS